MKLQRKRLDNHMKAHEELGNRSRDIAGSSCEARKKKFPRNNSGMPMNIQQSSPNRRGLRALELKEQGKTLTEIADYMHVSSERTRQILLRAGAEVEAYRKFEELKERCSTFLQRPEVPADILSLTVDYLNLSPRAINCLKHVHIKTIGELISKTSIHLSKIKNMGKKTLDEIEAVLDNVGLICR